MGLSISLGGYLAPNTNLRIKITTEEQISAEVIDCLLASGSEGSDGGTEQILCSSKLSISQRGSRDLQIEEVLTKLTVTISSGDNQLYQQTFSPTYAREEINGPGCGVCISAAIHLALPTAQP